MAVAILRANVAAADVDDDCINANEKSIELRASGKLLDARVESAKCAVETCPQEVQRVCGLRTEQITLALPSIVFELKDDAGADVPGVRVSVDGRSIGTAGTATAILLDPGEHSFVFELPGQTARIEKSFVLREGERQRRERILVPRQAAPETPKPDPGLAPTPVEGNDPVPGRAQRTVGLVVGGVGVVGLVLGGIFGLSAKSKWAEAQANCKPGCAPDAPAQSTKNDAQSAATLATVSAIAGATLVAGGAVVFFLAPSSRSPAAASKLRFVPDVGARSASFSFGGTF